MMINYDLLINRLQILVKDNIYVEDNNLYVRNALKYAIIALMEEVDKQFMLNLYKELEYKEEE